MIACVVPARLKSSRFPNKPLVDIMGTPMIIRVLSKIKEADVFSSLYCATDSDEIAELVKSHGFKAIMTKECKTGSDRIAQCLPQIKEKLILIG